MRYKKFRKKISFFDKRIKNKLPKITSINKIKFDEIDLIFLSLPNGQAQKLIKKLYKYKKIKFIDLSADFRITNVKIYEKNYNIKHNAKKLIRIIIFIARI